ncbi:hypothetical protein VTL71DRAFT_6864 [Oculimacula yallundae]|uniref:Fumarylacetoacetase-like C-terminal domain-containing protein n=1 Tax=Oculimacula yallundae TaxID=86028 RepID=A0ABR4BVV8_9HELO
MAAFHHVFRFEDSDAEAHYTDYEGDPNNVFEMVGKEVATRAPPFETVGEAKRVWPLKKVVKILSPIPAAAHIYGIGLNYKGHAEEAKLPIPEYPMIFSKPVDALAGPYEDIPIDQECKFMDYEGELCVIIGKDCKNISESEDPMDFVLGYTVANDVSSRYWQMPERAGQAGYAKGFDKFAPIGPILVSPQALPDIGSKTMTT